MVKNTQQKKSAAPQKSSKKESNVRKNIPAILNSPEYKNLVDEAINTINSAKFAMETSGYSTEDAEMFIKQRYLQNLQTFSDPVNGAIALLADLKTRIDVDSKLNPSPELVDDKYLKLLDEMRKTLKLVNDMKNKVIKHQVQVLDDNIMSFDDFIDADTEEVKTDEHIE